MFKHISNLKVSYVTLTSFPFLSCNGQRIMRSIYSHPITHIQYNCTPPFSLGFMMPNWLGAIRWQGSVAAGLKEVVLGDREVHALGREVQVNTVERKARWKKILRFSQTGLTSLDENIGESVH